MAEFAEVLLLDLPLDRTFTYRVPPALRERVLPGVRVTAPFRGRREVGFVARLSDRSEVPRVLDLAEADPEPLLDEKILDLTRWVAERYACSWSEALAAALPSGVKKASPARFVRRVSAGSGEGRTPRQREILEAARRLEGPLPLREFLRRTGASASTVASMIRAGLLREDRVRPEADVPADPAAAGPRDVRLTPEQEAALEEASRPGVVLLHGITGSGKTEVYLRAIERVVAAGRQAIVLVPEIALTPQTVSRFRARFSRVAVLHSVLTEADRAAQWRAARAGEVDVIVGARSAVFAPARSLGLIVLDEEHEGAYKQESVPRYHAREVAVERARREGATVILGSATPSLESLHRARAGDYRLARLPARVEGRELPEIEVVDMAAEQAELKRRPVLSRRLEQLARAALGRGERVILFLNRRGFLTHVSCARCGWFFHCRQCDVAMTYHRREDRAVCHYCSDARPLPPACPACQEGKLVQYGQGTERVEAEIRRLFPGFTVARMDSDSMRTRRDYRDALSAFREGRTDILVGTQMIAKGLDVPEVTLVGVVNADTAFHVPDFRAAERTFQLITQVAGRAGRGPRGGRVVVQTFFPRHDAIRAAAAYDFSGFVARELEHRREAGYPPFVSLVRLVVQGREEGRVEEAAGEAARRLREALPEPRARVLGPSKAPLYRLRGRYRHHLLVKAPDLGAVLPEIRRVAGSFPRTPKLQLAVDVDPIGLL